MIVIKPMKWFPGNQCMISPTLGSHRYVVRHLDGGEWLLETVLCPGTKRRHTSLEAALAEAKADLQAAISRLIS